jgi:hypothetical protein
MAKAATNAIRTTVVANSIAENPEFFLMILITSRIIENKTRASSFSLIIKYGKSDAVRAGGYCRLPLRSGNKSKSC